MKTLADILGILILISLWMTVLAICLFAVYLIVSIGMQFYYEYTVKIRLQAMLLKKEIERMKNETSR